MASAPETPNTGMSSRLLTMKFMQRAAASASSAPSPSSEERSSKRRRVEPSLETEAFSGLVDQAAVSAALQDQEAKRQAALATHSAELVDTHWVLDTVFQKPSGRAAESPLQVEYVSYADIDAINDSERTGLEALNGRTSTGNYKKKAKEQPKENNSSDEEQDDSDDGSSSPKSPLRSSARTKSRDAKARDGKASPSAHSAAREKLKKRKRSESVQNRELRDKRRKKEVNLNKKEVNLSNLTSLSGAGSSAPSTPSFSCYKCGQVGHKGSACPKGAGQRGQRPFNRSR